MKQFYLAEIVTKDKLIHQGIFFPTSSRKSGTSWGKPSRAILWVHGLTSTFYSNVPLITEFAKQCEKHGFGFASFNNRGHDILTSGKKVDPSKEKGYVRISGGSGIEVFKDSVLDVEAGIDFFGSQGFSKIIVIGHSSGSNKTCYFAATRNNPRVAGYVLAGPVSDLNAPGVDFGRIRRNVSRMKTFVNKQKGNVLVEDVYDIPLTPKRYLSLFDEASVEDMFDYFGSGAKLNSFLSKIHKPLMVILGAKDEYLNKPAREALKVFDRYSVSKNYKSVVIPGGLHSFNGKEREFVQAILEWAAQV